MACYFLSVVDFILCLEQLLLLLTTLLVLIFRRLDYFILSQKMVPNLCDSVIRSDVYGSDHCPITLLINI